MHHVRAFGAALLAGLVGCGLMLNFSGISDSTAATVGAVAAVVVWCAIVYHSEARVKHEGTASLHYTLIKDRLKPGLAYLDAGQSQRAIAFFDRVVESEPDNADAYFGRGLAYHDLERYQQAIADFDRVTEINPDHPYAFFQRGFVYHQLEQYQQAIADFTRAIEIKPDSWAYMLRGAAHSKLGQEELAQADFDQAAELSPTLNLNEMR